MPSESIAELPVKKAAINLVAAMATLPAMAAKIAVLDSGTMRYTIANEAARAESSEKTIRPSGLHQNRERTGVPKPGVPGAAERGPRPSISAGVPCESLNEAATHSDFPPAPTDETPICRSPNSATFEFFEFDRNRSIDRRQQVMRAVLGRIPTLAE